MMVDVLTFKDAMQSVQANNFHLLLGNGFSIAAKPDIFTYGSLYQNADFSKAPTVKKLFDALDTEDFEVVIKHLQDAALAVELYKSDEKAFVKKLRDDADAVKDALVSAIASRHPDRPYKIEAAQYAACRKFLEHFKHIFTLNYDVLLYWALMQDEVDEIDLLPDDGFRHPEDDPDKPWVSWQQSNSATVHYLHGALHLFDAGSEITKYTWSKTDLPIVDQIRAALDEDKFPLFVAEGTTDSKRKKILHSGYLHKALRSFEGCCFSPSSAIVIYGHSLAENDRHVLRCIEKGGAKNVLVSLYGDPNSSGNKVVVANAEKLAQGRSSRRPLTLTFYDAASAKVWG